MNDPECRKANTGILVGFGVFISAITFFKVADQNTKKKLMTRKMLDQPFRKEPKKKKEKKNHHDNRLTSPQKSNM
ncbi:hypothetical protein H4Q26_000432 [Puccinia striiformis f. sp. tritici PST-130]|nr:hypothetical protein H4Q26_000432 [Puccinia striiformis f. sp. tritici PST-130]